MRSRSYTLLFALVVGAAAHLMAVPATSAAAGTPEIAATAQPDPVAVADAAVTGTVVARYTFDASGAFRDTSGRGHTLTLVAGHGGTVRAVAHGTGHALAFPAKCAAKAAVCPHAVLQAPNSADLDPGIRPISYGAAVRLPRSQTTGGQNVLQKGYSATSSQYKLQIDGVAGRPSCVLVDDHKPRIRMVRSRVSVADGQWHTLECRRSGSSFEILVDGVTRGTLTIPAALSVTNSGPLSVGGKGASRNNDQFQGSLDNLWIRIG